jgi:hypothetical protein
MKFICLVYFEGNPFEGLSKDQQEALDRASLAYDVGLKATGNFIAAEALQGPGKAVTVRIQGGKPVVTEGSVSKTKEYLGGFILITAKDKDEAVGIASKIPVGQYASVEVRPIFEF